jgi:hypothetical protein
MATGDRLAGGPTLDSAEVNHRRGAMIGVSDDKDLKCRRC